MIFQKNKKIVAVLAVEIDASITMAVLAKRLGIPGVDPDIAETVHNKNKFRDKLKDLGYPIPKKICC